MISRMREWMAPNDSRERHEIAAFLLDPARSIVDVGGARGALAAFMTGVSITSVNITPDADIEIAPGPGALPIGDASFDAAVSLDTLEHIPRADRKQFVTELLRVANSRVVLGCPLGGPVRSQHEAENDAWFFALTGEHHRWIHEHIEHGPPTESELGELFDVPAWRATLLFSGDIRETSTQFRLSEASLRRRRPTDVARWFWHRVRARPRLELSTDSDPWTNRVFVVAERGR